MVGIAAIIWGFSFIWSKQLLGVMGSISIVFFRMIIATISLFIFGKISGLFTVVKRRDMFTFALLSLVQPFLYFIFELSSIKHNSPTLTALIIAQIPLFVALINLIFNKKKLSLNVGVGIAVSLLGVMLVIKGGDESINISTPLGILLAVCAMICAIAYNFFVENLVKKYNPLTITTYIHALAFIYFMPLFFIYEWGSIGNIPLTVDVISSIVFLGLFCSAIAFLLYIYGVKNIGIVKSSMINNLSPAVTAIGVFLFLDESLSIIQIGGIVVTIIGLSIGIYSRKNN